jgi:hypothetical protein
MSQHSLQVPARRQVQRDDTTRYLCAAAQLDSDFADRAIHEFLVEPTRPVPPSPGTDTVAVLGEAVAARARRKYRDGTLLALAMVTAFTAPGPLLMAWILVGLVAGLPQLLTSWKSSTTGKKRMSWIIPVIGAVAVVFFLFQGPGLLEDMLDGRKTRSSSTLDKTSDTGLTVVALLMIAGMLGVLVADRIIVWQHLTRRFSRTSGPIADPIASNRQIVANSNAFAHELRRVAAAVRTQADPESSPLVVYRGYSPFVGTGFEYKPWSIAVPLQRVAGKPHGELNTDVFYRRIREAMSDMGRATPLTPGKRLGALRVFDQIIVPAGELIDHIADPGTRPILADLDHPPYQAMAPADVARLRADPEEWARYYLCVQVETWDRDVVVSVFVHAAMDEDTLYVEWTPCVLLPIKPEYQAIDRMPRSPLRPVMNALLRLVRLPATIVPSTVHLCSRLRGLPRDEGIVDERMYGSAFSIRELAADDDTQNYFQTTDIHRYLKILESRYTLTVARLLDESGYSKASFNQQVMSVTNKNININGSVHGNVNTGDGVQQGDINPGKEN